MLSFCLCYLFIAVSFGAVGSNRNPIECGEHEFSCKNGQCIDKKLWCDNFKDCYDGSDERNCKRNTHDLKPERCPPNFFRCNNGLCIPMSGRCDGFNSCSDSSDEHNCSRESNVTSSSKTDKKYPGTFNVQRPSLKAFSGVNFTNGFQDDSDQDETYDAYYELDTSQFAEQEERARKWLLSRRKEDYGWDDYTERAIVALSLSKDGLDENTLEEKLMIKQLHLKLAVALARNETKMELSDLALYINALQASCGEARNFYGFDLVSKLRDRVDQEHYNGRYAMPLVYLTLCLNNALNNHDVKILQDLFLNRDVLTDKNGIQALVLLANLCMKMNKNQDAKNFVALQSRLVNKISEGLAGNVYEVALIFQALNAAQVNPDTWNRSETVEFILKHQDDNGSFGDILATYYVLPILSGNCLLSLRKNCDKSNSDDLTPIEVLSNVKNRIHVNYSLYFGNPVEMSQTMFFSLSEGTTLFDMMRLAEERNGNYRFSLDEKKDVPTVYSISGVPNDAERGIYWGLYLKKKSRVHASSFDEVPISDNIKKLVLREGEEIIFWRRPV